ncbi:MAG TPA: hypothetical protein VM847_12340 [Tahibacter sp.]|nr:hypothetical protein [Tahibacter sp.]
MSNTAGPRRFVAPTWVRLLCGFGALATPAAAWILYAERGLSWLTLITMAMAAFAPLALLDALTARVELHAEHLVIVSNLRRRQYRRSDLLRLRYGRGVKAAIAHVAGQWIELPDVGSGNQSLCNSLRAWLERSAA